jgi:hypothetical protein
MGPRPKRIMMDMGMGMGNMSGMKGMDRSGMKGMQMGGSAVAEKPPKGPDDDVFDDRTLSNRTSRSMEQSMCNAFSELSAHGEQGPN